MKRVANRTRTFLGGSITPGSTVPGAPTIGTATAGNTTATVAFTAPGNDGGAMITGYRATSTPGGITATGVASPIVVTGLTNGTAYTFTVAAQNVNGFGAESSASNSVTPSAIVLALNNRLIPGDTSGGIELRRNGTLFRRSNGVATTQIPGEWVASGATATIGDLYQVSFNGGAWSTISTSRPFEVALGASFTAAIRLVGSTDVIVSATFTVE